MSERIFVCIPAAGVGQRFGADLPKQYWTIAGKTVLQHALEQFFKPPWCNEIYLALHEQDKYFASKIEPSKQIIRVVGGETRQQSVLNLLESIKMKAQDSDWVLVHDAARPYISNRDINHLIKSLHCHPVGGILAKPVTSTLKLSKNGSQIERTIERCALWEALTPQMFRFGKLYQSMKYCLKHGLTVTDEAQALERQGLIPNLIQAEDPIPKLTLPSDLPVLENLLQIKHEECVLS